MDQTSELVGSGADARPQLATALPVGVRVRPGRDRHLQAREVLADVLVEVGEDCHGFPFNYGVELFDGQQPAIRVAVGQDYLGVREGGEKLVGKENA